MGVTIIDRLFASLDALTGKFIRIIGGSNLGGFAPSPEINPPNTQNQRATPAQFDSVGNLAVRGPSYSDEGSFADDFIGSSINAALTGTVTFTNGSITVTGVGTLFTTEVDISKYVKLNADANTAWARVARVLSDTSLELVSPYTGAGGSGASSSSNWIQTVGAGGSISVGSGNVTLASGTTNGSVTSISRDVDFPPLHNHLHIAVSQRIANQSIFCGFKDSSGAIQAGIIFDGTVNTTVKFHCQTSNAASDIQEVTVTLPFGLTTATELSYEIDVTPRATSLSIQGVLVAQFTEHIPGPYVVMASIKEIRNTGVPASSTNLVLDIVQICNYDQSQITNITASEAIPVQIREESHYISAILNTTATTADQTIISFTVPANKVAYIVGFSVGNSGNTDGVPIKIGKNTVTTEPAAPGTVDGNIFRSFFLNRANLQPYNEDYSAMPRPVGGPGDVLKITVTPSGTGATAWRASLDIVLRPS